MACKQTHLWRTDGTIFHERRIVWHPICFQWPEWKSHGTRSFHFKFLLLLPFLPYNVWRIQIIPAHKFVVSVGSEFFMKEITLGNANETAVKRSKTVQVSNTPFKPFLNCFQILIQCINILHLIANINKYNPIKNLCKNYRNFGLGNFFIIFITEMLH